MSDGHEPSDKKHPTEVKAEHSHRCGFCKLNFPTTNALYAHQQKEHDPDGIMFSEIGLPK